MNPDPEIICIISVGLFRRNTGIRVISNAIRQGAKVYVIWREGCPQIKEGMMPEWQLSIQSASLSHSRNIAIEHLIKNTSTKSSAIVFFADDDGDIPDGFVQTVKQVFGKADLDWAMGVYGPSKKDIDRNRFPSRNLDTLSSRQILIMASSLGVFVRYGILKNVGYFNTQLGKGARIPIGEDTEYVMRLRDCSTKYQYSPELIQIHAYHKKLKNEKLTSFRFLVYKSFSKPSLSIHAMRSALALVVKHEARLIDVFNVISEEVRYFLEK